MGEVKGGQGGVIDVRVEAVGAVDEPEDEDGGTERRPELHALPCALEREQHRTHVPKLGSEPVPDEQERLQYAGEAAEEA